MTRSVRPLRLERNESLSHRVSLYRSHGANHVELDDVGTSTASLPLLPDQEAIVVMKRLNRLMGVWSAQQSHQVCCPVVTRSHYLAVDLAFHARLPPGRVQGWRACPHAQPGCPTSGGAPPDEHRKAAPLTDCSLILFLRIRVLCLCGTASTVLRSRHLHKAHDVLRPHVKRQRSPQSDGPNGCLLAARPAAAAAH